MGRDGVLIVDKPEGPTSHDVVQRVRRALGIRRVGHAGTLDPAASGVLVILVGQGTKLGPYLSADDKRYVARVALGVATSTLDREGEIVSRAELPDTLQGELAGFEAAAPCPALEAALQSERERTEQIPPAFSAIKVAGRRSYERARSGVSETLAARPVAVRRLTLLRADAARHELEIELETTKGYYVRAFARDLAERLGTVAHLSALRRTGSGPFTLSAAVALDDPDLARHIRPIADAAREAMDHAVLTSEGEDKAIVGKVLQAGDFATPPPPHDRPFAWISPRSLLIAIGRGDPSGGGFSVLRGFVAGAPIAGGGVGPLSSTIER